MRARRALSRLGAVRTATFAIATASSKRPAVIRRWLRSSRAYSRSWRNRSRSISIQAAVQPGRMSAVSTVGVGGAVSAGIVGRPGSGAIASARSTSTSAPSASTPAIAVSSSRPRHVDGRDGIGERAARRRTPGQRSAASAARACGRGCTAR